MKKIKRLLAGSLIVSIMIPQITFSQSSGGDVLYLNEFDGAAPTISYDGGSWYDTTFGTIQAQGGILSLSGITGNDTGIYARIHTEQDVFPGATSSLGLIVGARVRIVTDLPDIGFSLFTDDWAGDSAETSLTNEWVELEFTESIDFTDIAFEFYSNDGAFSPTDTVEIDWIRVSTPVLVPGVYYNAAVNNDWSTLENWWADDAFTVPANVLPGPESDVVISGLVSSDNSNAATVNTALFVDGSELRGITLTAATTTFEAAAINRGTVEGNAVFNLAEGGSITLGDGMYWGTVNGSSFGSDDILITDFIFNASSTNVGTVPGNATFNPGSENQGTVQGDALVNYPYVLPLGGTVNGSLTYSGYTTYYYNNATADGNWANLSNWWLDASHQTNPSSLPGPESDVYIQANVTSSGVGAVEVANATFSSGVTWGAGLSLTVSGDAFFNAALNSGSVTGSTTFSGSTARNNSSGSVTGTVHFEDGARNYGSITGSAVFNLGSTHQNGGEITGNAVFNDSSTLSGSSIIGEAIFNNSYNNGTVGSSTFNGLSGHLLGTVESATFNDDSYNNRLVSGNATFNGSSYNNGVSIYSVIAGDAVFNDNSQNRGVVQGNAEFNDSSSNTVPANPSLGKVQGNAVFRDNSSNTGTIEGNADVYFPVSFPLGGTVGGVLTYYDYPEGVYYNNAAADGDWANVMNWWADVDFTQQAGSIPTEGADVFVYASVTQNTGGPVSLNSVQFMSGASNGIEITVANEAVFSSGSYNMATINGSAVFEDGSYNSDVVGSVVNGNATFEGSAYNQGTVNGDVVFSAASGGTLIIPSGQYWQGDISGTMSGGDSNPITHFVFQDGSYNAGTVPAGATFEGSAYNNGTVEGDATFEDSAYNNGTIEGSATFEVSLPSGQINGNVVYTPASAGVLTLTSGQTWNVTIGGEIRGGDNALVTQFVFQDGSYNAGTVPAGATFEGSAYNNGTVEGDATFEDSSYNAYSGVVEGNAFFYGSSYNGGFVAGNATLNDSSYNSGTVGGDLIDGSIVGTSITITSGNSWGSSVGGILRNASGDPVTLFIFEDGSYNAGVVTGNALFNGSAYNDGLVTGDATFASSTGGIITIASGNTWSGRVAGAIRGGDSSSIMQYVFEDGSHNRGTVQGNAVFDGNSYNNGTTTGDAVFNDTSYNNFGRTILGNATFNDDALNKGIVSGDAIYSTASGGIITLSSGQVWMGRVLGTVRGGDSNPITQYVFEDGSYSIGRVSGDATFESGSYNQGTVTGDATFEGSAYNQGDILGDAIYSWGSEGTLVFGSGYTFFNDGSVGGEIRGGDGEPITHYVFEGTSTNSSTWLSGIFTFRDSSTNWGTTTGPTAFSDSAINERGIVGEASFGGTSENRGSVQGDTVFTGSALNIGTVVGSVIFNDTSNNNAGRVLGNATYNDESFNSSGATVSGNATFNDASSNIGSTISGDATFNDESYNRGTVGGNAVFNDSSAHQLGTIEGDAVFNGMSLNSSDVSGDATFNDDSRNAGDITGDVTFNNASVLLSGSFGGTVTRRFTIATSTTLNFLTEGARNDWRIVADGILLDLSGATYGGTNVFQARNGGSFIPEPDPVLSIARPNEQIITSWSPLISWGNANVCEYSYSGESSYQSVDCSMAGSDIPAPEDGLRTLSVRAMNPQGNINEKSFSFRYSPPTQPVFASSNTSTFKATSLSRKLANIRSQSSSAVSSVLSTVLPAPGSAVSFSRAALERLINVLRGPSAVPVSIGITPSGAIVTSFAPALFSPEESLLSSCPDMAIGSVGPCVRSLQKFLNAQGFGVVDSGPGSRENETTYFGPATRAALVRFQSSKSVAPADGRFESRTKAVISALGR